MADSFLFELVSPERLVISEQATAVVVPGSEGQFTVMTGHAPVIALLRPGIVEATLADGGTRRVFLRGGFADTTPDALTILAEQAVPLEDLDSATLDEEITRAEAAVSAADDGRARDAAELKLSQLREVQAVLRA